LKYATHNAVANIRVALFVTFQQFCVFLRLLLLVGFANKD